MIRTNVVTAALAAGFMLMSAGSGFAADAAPPAAGPSKPTSSPPLPPLGPTYVWLSTHHGVPGMKLRVDTTCEGKESVSSPALTIKKYGTTGQYEVNHVAIVNDVKPGDHEVVLSCYHPDRGGITTYSSAGFTVLEKPDPPTPGKPPVKQVPKVPVGAPRTGDGSTVE